MSNSTAESSDNVFENFELHYDNSSKDVHGLILEILVAASSRQKLHGWDDQLHASPIKRLTGAAREYWRKNYASSSNALLSHSHVERVVTTDGVCCKQPTVDPTQNVAGHLFFAKVNREEPVPPPDSTDPSRPRRLSGDIPRPPIRMSKGYEDHMRGRASRGPKYSQGLVMYVFDEDTFFQSSAAFTKPTVAKSKSRSRPSKKLL